MQHTRRLLLYFVIIGVIMGLTACSSPASKTGTSGGPASNTGTSGSPVSNTGTSGATTGEQSEGNTATPTATPTPVGHFKVGQTVNVGNLDQVTVNSVKIGTGGQYSTPTRGKVYLLIGITIKNVSAAEQQLSAFNYTLRDVTGVAYSQVSINPGNSPWGKVGPRQLIRGQLVYEVPGTQKVFTLSFQADLTSPGHTIWDIYV